MIMQIFLGHRSRYYCLIGIQASESFGYKSWLGSNRWKNLWGINPSCLPSLSPSIDLLLTVSFLHVWHVEPIVLINAHLEWYKISLSLRSKLFCIETSMRPGIFCRLTSLSWKHLVGCRLVLVGEYPIAAFVEAPYSSIQMLVLFECRTVFRLDQVKPSCANNYSGNGYGISLLQRCSIIMVRM